MKINNGKNKKQKKKGISLIVLVITIIVMIILAGTIILTLDNTGVIDRANEAVEKTNLAEVQNLASLKWAEAFMAGKTTQKQLETEVINGLDKENIDLTQYNVIVTDEGVTVTLKNGNSGVTAQIPEEWKANVIKIVDTVPIPKGFVASSAIGENTKNGGLVIYEGTEPVTDANVEDAKRTRNQYVWVPVEDFSKFVRQNFGKSYTIISNTLGSNGSIYWEVILDLNTNIPDVEANKLKSAYMTITTPNGGITNTLAEVQAMYSSVKEYKGFYIARYEAGLEVKEAVEGSADIGQRTERGTSGSELPGIKAGTTVYSVMGKIPYNYIPWTYNDSMAEDTNGAVEVARSIYPETNTNYGVVSTLTYGVQWDRTLAWWVETKAKNGTGDVTIEDNDDLNNSMNYGNYYNNAISTFNTGAMVSKDSGVKYTAIDTTYSKTSIQSHLLTTGATEEARVNNIYDMAGNLYEWTMEGNNTVYRVIRGSCYRSVGNDSPVSSRNYYGPHSVYDNNGFRPALYIKK